jgi:hypothetical protein
VKVELLRDVEAEQLLHHRAHTAAQGLGDACHALAERRLEQRAVDLVVEAVLHRLVRPGGMVAGNASPLPGNLRYSRLGWMAWRIPLPKMREISLETRMSPTA